MGRTVLVIAADRVVRRAVCDVVAGLDGVGAVAGVGSGLPGLRRLADRRPDVIVVDLRDAGIDPLVLLAFLAATWPGLPVILVGGPDLPPGTDHLASLGRGTRQALADAGETGVGRLLPRLQRELATLVRRAAQVRPAGPGTGGQAARPAPRGAYWIAALAVSTGGPDALRRVVPLLPADYPLPVVVVQHMPAEFTRTLAASLDRVSHLDVSEAVEGAAVVPGRVLIAPGGRHMTVTEVGGRLRISLNDDPPEQSVRPAADVLLRSLAAIRRRGQVLGVIMTGMGEDGLAGVRQLGPARLHCLTQSEASCAVYGMPRAVDLAGLSDERVDLDRIASRLVTLAAAPTVARHPLQA